MKERTLVSDWNYIATIYFPGRPHPGTVRKRREIFVKWLACNGFAKMRFLFSYNMIKMEWGWCNYREGFLMVAQSSRQASFREKAIFYMVEYNAAPEKTGIGLA